MRNGDWLQTATGRQFWPIDPLPEDICIEDIAAALSKQCRFGGHCTRFYSVAEHCVLLSQRASAHLKLGALLHDAAEAYIVDVPRPLKKQIPHYELYETRLMECIATRFGFVFPLDEEVKRLDNAILADEQLQCMKTAPADWNLTEAPLGLRLQFFSPARAEWEFLMAFYRYGGRP